MTNEAKDSGSNKAPPGFALAASLHYLKSLCDGAHAQDGQGFNGNDAHSPFVEAMLARDPAALTENMQLALLRLLTKYRKQLTAGGLALPTEPEVRAQFRQETPVASLSDVEAKPLVHMVFDATRNAVAGLMGGRAGVIPPPGTAAPGPNGEIGGVIDQDPEDERVYIKFGGYGAPPEAYRNYLKTFRDWQYDGATHLWSVPGSRLDSVRKRFSWFQLSTRLAAKLAAAEADEDAKAAAAEAEKILRETRALKLVAALDLDAPMKNGHHLFEHQKAAFHWAIRRGKVILADEMGLGKTLSSLMVAKAYQKVYHVDVFVICPAGLRGNWVKEANNAGVFIETISWGKIPPPPTTRPFVVLADEAHYAQSWGQWKLNPETNQEEQVGTLRTASFLRFMDSPNCLAGVLITGTPIKNGRPMNFYPLLYAIHHPLSVDKRAYEKRYANAHATRFTSHDTSGSAHLDELYQKTRDFMLRRKKSECLDLPAKTRVLHTLTLTRAEEAEYAKYRDEQVALFKERVANNIERAKEEVEPLLKELEGKQAKMTDAAYEREKFKLLSPLRQAQNSRNAEALVTLLYLRKKSSDLKLDEAILLAQEVIEEDRQAVLFVEFVESGRELASRLDCRFISGGIGQVQRDEMIAEFQAGDKKAIVCTFKAGGVGITLTAADTVILVDRPWTPGDAVQGEDRIHRIGQTRNVTALWIQATEVDEKIDNILLEKQGNIDLILEGRGDEGSEEVNIRDIAVDVLSLFDRVR